MEGIEIKIWKTVNVIRFKYVFALGEKCHYHKYEHSLVAPCCIVTPSYLEEFLFLECQKKIVEEKDGS